MSQPVTEPTSNPYAPSAPQQAVIPPADAAVLPDALSEQVRVLFERGRNGSAWFYWVAGLSAINAVIALAGGNGGFALGLGVTTIANVIAVAAPAGEARSAAIIVAVVFNIIVLGMVVLCGWLSQKRILPVFAVGMLLYFFDGLLFLPFGDIMSIGIHAFALFCMWNGFSAYRQLNALERQLASASYAPDVPPAPV
jgi:hypothetical protein